MNKSFWGPYVWRTLHSFAASYNENNSYVFESFVNSLVFLLPCLECRINLEIHLKKIPLKRYLKNKDTVFYWSYLLHDSVNKSLNKKSPSFEYVKKLYNKVDCKKCKNINFKK